MFVKLRQRQKYKLKCNCVLDLAAYLDGNCFPSAPAGQCSTTLTFAALFLDVAKPIVYIYPLLPVVLPLRELTPKCVHSNKLRYS